MALATQCTSNAPLVVGVAELKFAASGVVMTHALGSCVAVSAHDPARGISGMLHLLLPDSRQDPARAGSVPAMFADTGIAKLLEVLLSHGARVPGLRFKLVGGASVLGGGPFNIGKRNVLAARKLLWKRRLPLDGEEVGGEISRSVALDAMTGALTITTPGMEPRTL